MQRVAAKEESDDDYDVCKLNEQLQLSCMCTVCSGEAGKSCGHSALPLLLRRGGVWSQPRTLATF